MANVPLAPIFSTPPHLECPAGPLWAWFTEPRGGVLQLAEAAEFSVEMARWVVGPALERMVERFQTDSGFLLVLDVRPMTSRSGAVRTLFMDKARESAGMFSAVVVLPPQRINPLYLTGLHAAAALVSAFGTTFEITGDLDRVLADRGVRPASW